jgi:hypothetical protein
VAFLRLGGYETTAFAAPEKAAIQIRFQFGGLGLAFLRHDFLHPVEQALGNNRLVPPLIQLAVESHHAIEKWVVECPLIIGYRHGLVHVGEKPKTVYPCVNFMEGEVLLTALDKGFAKARELGAPEKAIIFTESTRTQEYLYRVLEQTAYAGKIVLFNGSNKDAKSKQIYAAWMEKHKGTDRVTGAPSADMRQALVDYFRDEAVILHLDSTFLKI